MIPWKRLKFIQLIKPVHNQMRKARKTRKKKQSIDNDEILKSIKDFRYVKRYAQPGTNPYEWHLLQWKR